MVSKAFYFALALSILTQYFSQAITDHGKAPNLGRNRERMPETQLVWVELYRIHKRKQRNHKGSLMVREISDILLISAIQVQEDLGNQDGSSYDL